MIRSLLLALALLLALPASANQWVPIQSGSNIQILPYPLNDNSHPSASRALTLTGDAGRVSDSYRIERFPGYTTTIGRTITKTALLRGLAGAAQKAGTIGLAVTVAKAAWCEYDPSGVLCDPGQNKQDQPMWRCGTSQPWAYATPMAACSARFSGYTPTTPWNCGNWQNSGSVQCSMYATYACTVNNQPSTCGPVQVADYADRKLSQVCPAVPGLAGYETQGGPPGADGKCPTGTKLPVDEAAAATKMLPHLTTDKVVEMIREAMARGIDLSNKASSPSVTGPAQVTGQPQITRETLPDGTVRESTSYPRWQFTYPSGVPDPAAPSQPVTITYNTTNVTNNYDGTTVEVENPEDEEEPVNPATDPSMPEVPDLYEQKYPDGLAGVWATRSAEMQQTPIFGFLQGFVPSFSDGGCPAWSLPVMSGIGQTWTANISLPCSLWATLRVIVLLSALFACRRIIFGG